MDHTYKSTTRLGILLLGFIVLTNCTTNTPATGLGDHEIAITLVEQCANIQAGDFVRISGGAQDAPLLEKLAIQVRKKGAFPLVLLSSGNAAKMYYEEVPPKYDSQSPAFALELANLITANIVISNGSPPDLLKGVSVERRVTVAKAGAPYGRRLMERNVRQVFLGNGLYPTEASADQFGITKAALAEIFWNGINTDYDELSKICQSVESILAKGNKVHITTPDGTDLTVGIANRPILSSDGIIPDTEAARGGASGIVYLPAGEVYVTPVKGTANGQVVLKNFFFQGEEIKDLKLTFVDGSLTNMTASSGLATLQQFYDAASQGKEEFAFVDIGINPDVVIPEGSRMLGWMPAGMVTVGIGGNSWAGGDNISTYGLITHLKNATMMIDGEALVSSGKLNL